MPKTLDSVIGRVFDSRNSQIVTVWSCLMDRQKSQKVAYQFSVQDFQSFSQSEA
jgi:hypothetical protein